jgi:hypothetical protein
MPSPESLCAFNIDRRRPVNNTQLSKSAQGLRTTESSQSGDADTGNGGLAFYCRRRIGKVAS